MRKKYIIFIIIFFIVIVAVATTTVLSQERLENGLYEIENFSSKSKKEITLLEAYHLGMNLAKKYDKSSKLIYLNSVDDGKPSGLDGKKANWQGIISLPDQKHNIVFGIDNGNLKNYRVIDSSEDYTISDNLVKIDSTQILKNAREKFKLEPITEKNDFANGYHFRILRDAENVFMAVSGQIDNKNVEIYYNPKDGSYLGRTEDNNIKN